MNEGLKGWSKSGFANMATRMSSSTNNTFIVATNRKGAVHGFTQKYFLQKDTHYVTSAWVQVSQGDMIHVALAFGTAFGIQRSGWAIARSGCWSMLKGGFVLNISGPVELYLEANNTVVELWADSISVKPFSLDEWKFHQDQSTEKVFKKLCDLGDYELWYVIIGDLLQYSESENYVFP
nr:endo-1,4-beta-xylanase 5-like [Nicotiana tomentosiformis]